jgi:hypothetical protein
MLGIKFTLLFKALEFPTRSGNIILKLLEQALRQKFKNPIYAKYLMNTGYAKLYYKNNGYQKTDFN